MVEQEVKGLYTGMNDRELNEAGLGDDGEASYRAIGELTPHSVISWLGQAGKLERMLLESGCNILHKAA